MSYHKEIPTISLSILRMITPFTLYQENQQMFYYFFRHLPTNLVEAFPITKYP